MPEGVIQRTKRFERIDPLASAELLLGREIEAGASRSAGPLVNI
jgi:hypothetical protein